MPIKPGPKPALWSWLVAGMTLLFLTSWAGLASAQTPNPAELITQCRDAAWYRINGVGVTRMAMIDQEAALSICQTAQTANPDAPVILAYMARILVAGKHYKQGYLAAKTAANANIPEGMTYLGVLISVGQGEAKDLAKSTRLYQRAAASGDASAMRFLYTAFRAGKGVEANIETAMDWLQRSAEAGSVSSQLVLGRRLLTGRDIEKDQVKAVFWLTKAADQDDVDAWNTLGDLYRRGQSVPKDLDVAIGWYLKTATRNSDHGLFMLGVSYHLRGREDDLENALAAYGKVLAIREQAKGPDHPDVARVLYNMGLVYQKLNRNEEALQAYERTLRIRETTFGPKGKKVMGVLAKLGEIHVRLTRHQDALLMYDRLLAYSQETYGPDHANVAGVLMNMAVSYRKLGQLDDALSTYQRALNIIETTYGKDHAKTSDALNNMGNVLTDMARYDEAMTAFTQALDIRQKTYGPDHRAVADVLINIAIVDRKQTRLEAAMTALQQARKIYETDLGPTSAKVALVLTNMGVIYREQNDFEEALQSYERALGIYERVYGPDHVRVAAVLNNLANVYEGLARDEDALVAYGRALDIFEKAYGPDHIRVGTILHNMGTIYRKLAQYDQALDVYTRAIPIRERALGPDHPDVADTVMNIGVVYSYLGQYPKALDAYERALAIQEKVYGPDHVKVGNVLGNIGLAYKQMERYEEALPVFLRALDIFEKAYGPQHTKVADTLGNIGVVQYDLGQYELAMQTAQRALQIRQNLLGTTHPTIAGLYNNMGNALGDMGREADAVGAYAKALALYSLNKSANLDGLRQVYGNIARLRRDRGDPNGTIFYAKLSVNAQQQIRAQNTGLSRTFTKSLAESRSSIYQTLADALIAQGRFAEAQFVLDLLKEYELFEFVRGDTSQGDPRQGRMLLDTAETARQARLDAALAPTLTLGAEARNLRELQQQQALSPAQSARLIEVDAQLDTSLDGFVIQMNTLLAQASDADTPNQPNPDELDARYAAQQQQELAVFGGRAVLLRLATLSTGLHLFVTTPQTMTARQVDISPEYLSRLVFDAVSAVEHRSPDANTQLQALYEVLIAPVTEDLNASGADTIMLSLTGFLRYVPFSALYSGDHYLIEDYAIALHTPAARTRYQTVARNPQSAVGFGVTAAHAELGFAALPGVGIELEAIFAGKDATGSLGGQPLLDTAFDQTSLQTGLQTRPQIIHLASHFQFTPGKETDSFLLLGTGGKLSIDQLRTDDRFLLRGVDLLTLSACSTARGGKANGSEVESFGAVAQKRGAGAVLATLWPVADASTAHLMTDFYAGLMTNDLDKAQALRRAQLALLRGEKAADIDLSRGAISFGTALAQTTTITTAHPYFWAPFILMGNWL